MQPPDAMAMSRSPALEPQRLEVDERVLPDLRIDEAAEREREQALLDALAADRLVAVHGLAQAAIARAPQRGVLCGDSVLGSGHSSPGRLWVF